MCGAKPTPAARGLRRHRLGQAEGRLARPRERRGAPRFGDLGDRERDRRLRSRRALRRIEREERPLDADVAAEARIELQEERDVAERRAPEGNRIGLDGVGFARGEDCDLGWREHDAPWVRPCLRLLLLGTGVLYLWGLGASGWANTYYSGAVRSMASSWHAFLYGSLDQAGLTTVDKPPLALWVQALSVRAFGFHSLSILVPHALMGVASTAVYWLIFLAPRTWLY